MNKEWARDTIRKEQVAFLQIIAKMFFLVESTGLATDHWTKITLGTLYGKSRMCSVSFHLMDWVPAQSKEQSASNILKNISWIEFIITWKSLF